MFALGISITTQAILGGIDNLWHHELTAWLPSTRAAAPELALHALREGLYGFLFFALAWYEWHGISALCIAAALAAEVITTLVDFLVEDRTRRLPPFERILHTLLAINFGVMLALLAPELVDWGRMPTAVLYKSNAYSWLFSFFGFGISLWSLRNFIAVLNLTRPPSWVRNPLTAGAPSGRVVLVTGGTGFIGRHLVRRLVRRGDNVVVLTRSLDKALDLFGPQVRALTTLAAIADAERIDAIINLAGAPMLAFPWTGKRRETLLGSRVEVTRGLVELMARLKRPPKALVSASAIGFYGIANEDAVDEHSAPGGMFQSRLCRDWEAAAQAAEDLGVRVARVRLGLVLGADAGSFPKLALPHRMGLGAVLGDGRQWMSWIHIEDLVRLFEFLLKTPGARGAFNAVSPNPIAHRPFQEAIARQLHRPMWLRIPAAWLRRGLGEMSQLLVDGQRVLPNRTVAMGFYFRYQTLDKALADLLRLRPRALSSASANIYFNGACPVCRAEMRHYSLICSSSAPAIQFIDSSRHAEELVHCGLRREHFERRVYACDAEGRLLSGMSALIALWSRMPHYSLLARIMRLPLIRQAAELIYDHIVAPGLAVWASRRTRVIEPRVL
jgi:hypothetical protein